MLDITCHGEPQGRLKLESQIITSAGEDVEKSERCRLLAGRNWCFPLGNRSGNFLKTYTYPMTWSFASKVLTLEKTCVHVKTRKQMSLQLYL